MLFTSGLRKAVEQYNPSDPDSVAKALADRRAKQMRRRHTCASFKPELPQATRQIKRNTLVEEDENEAISAPIPTVPAVPSAPPVPPFAASKVAPFDNWGNDTYIPPTHPQIVPHESISQRSHAMMNDDFDDEWTDDDEEGQETELPPAPGFRPTASNALEPRSTSLGRTQSTTSGIGQQTKISRSINRFTQFVKSGMESYILSDTLRNVPAHERLEIIISNQGPVWRPVDQHYFCTIDKPKKESKLKGLKSFIAYSLTSSASGIQVARRYKHFDWLHEQLQSKFIMLSIPPLPEKQVAGRYEEDLIDHRKHILQLYVNKICRHPVISRSEVWLHFMTCTDEKQWKNGKRKAEKDEFVGGNFLYTVHFPEQPLQMHDVERQMDVFQRGVRSMEDSVRVMSERLATFQKLYSGSVKQNWQRMATAFQGLGQSFETDGTPASARMMEALHRTGHQYNSIGDEVERHTKEDMEPVLESLFTYKGTIQSVPDILSLHKQAVGKFRETEGKASAVDVERIRKRVDNASYLVLAEMNHLNAEKVEDFKQMMGTYLKKQAEFHQKCANTLNELARLYS